MNRTLFNSLVEEAEATLARKLGYADVPQSGGVAEAIVNAMVAILEAKSAAEPERGPLDSRAGDPPACDLREES